MDAEDVQQVVSSVVACSSTAAFALVAFLVGDARAKAHVRLSDAVTSANAAVLKLIIQLKQQEPGQAQARDPDHPNPRPWLLVKQLACAPPHVAESALCECYDACYAAYEDVRVTEYSWDFWGSLFEAARCAEQHGRGALVERIIGRVDALSSDEFGTAITHVLHEFMEGAAPSSHLILHRLLQRPHARAFTLRDLYFIIQYASSRACKFERGNEALPDWLRAIVQHPQWRVLRPHEESKISYQSFEHVHPRVLRWLLCDATFRANQRLLLKRVRAWHKRMHTSFTNSLQLLAVAGVDAVDPRFYSMGRVLWNAMGEVRVCIRSVAADRAVCDRAHANDALREAQKMVGQVCTEELHSNQSARGRATRAKVLRQHVEAPVQRALDATDAFLNKMNATLCRYDSKAKADAHAAAAARTDAGTHTQADARVTVNTGAYFTRKRRRELQEDMNLDLSA